MAKPHLGTLLRFRQQHPTAASFYASATDSSQLSPKWAPSSRTEADNDYRAGSRGVVPARAGTSSCANTALGKARDQRDVVAARKMLAWHARAMHSFWLTSNDLMSD